MTADELMEGLKQGFIDREINAQDQYLPQLITNNPSKNEKVITTIKDEMNSCDEFMFNVAFVTWDGVNILLDEFKSLENRNIKGKILASQYQNFTDPVALKRLRSFKNIEVKIVTLEQMKMHSKCYIFKKKDYYDVVIGSSNLTNRALCENCEWNLKFNSKDSGKIINDIVQEFNKIFEYATPIDDIWIEEYSLIYNDLKTIRKAIKSHDTNKLSGNKQIVPNKMQAEALFNLDSLRKKGKDRALVISATGSGKTYLSAFDAKKFGGKMLYVVHRNQILNKSIESFKKVMDDEKTIARYNPEQNNTDNDCTFSTIQTISKPEVLDNIPKDEFDYILIDEVHHIGAETYQRVVNHFKPKFMLGMTATPDRTDGYDVYGFFDYNIAYDIRLKQALEYKLVCPFHYFGITDLEINDESYDDMSKFNSVEFEQRVKYIVEKINFYGYCGNRVKGIVFCSRINEAHMLSDKFNSLGFRTAYVDGGMKSDYVEKCIEKLESDEYAGALDYIFTADLFNEGVDIPSVNQIVMLRPTESPIVYIQQLGRGLRIHEDKDFVVVLDFIGNYDKNFNIPIALSDDRSYNKSETRRFVAAGDCIIPGTSTISFDEISKKRIYESIDNSDFANTKILFEGYYNLKLKLGKIPRLTDFRKYGSINALNILSKYKSYHNFLVKKEKEYSVSFSKEQINYLEYVTKIIAPGKRLLEIEVLKMINGGTENVYEEIKKIRPELDKNAIENIIGVFNGHFYRINVKFIDENNRILDTYKKMLSDDNFFDQITQIIELGEENYVSDYSETYDSTNFVLNKMYTYDDVCRFMNWDANVNAQNIGGYKYDTKTNTFSIFINYVKDENVVESQRYGDYFENRNVLIAESKSTEDKDSKNMTRVRDSKTNSTDIHLFVRKNKNDEGSKEFYYLGKVKFDSFLNNNKPVKIRYILDNEVRMDLYEYFNS